MDKGMRLDVWNYRGYRVEMFQNSDGYRIRLTRNVHYPDVNKAGAHWLLPAFKTVEMANTAARKWVQEYGVRPR